MNTNLSALLERVEVTTEPDRLLDGDIALALGEVPEAFPNRSYGQPYLWKDGGPGLHARTWLAPNYSASIDAALGLVETKLPGQWPTILRAALSTLSKRHWWHTDHAKDAQRKELPAAILTALLRVLSQHGSEK